MLKYSREDKNLGPLSQNESERPEWLPMMILGTSELEHKDEIRSGSGRHVEPRGASPIVRLKFLGSGHTSPGIWLEFVPSESVTSFPRAELITNTFISLVMKNIYFIRKWIRVTSDSRCYSSDLLPNK